MPVPYVAMRLFRTNKGPDLGIQPSSIDDLKDSKTSEQTTLSRVRVGVWASEVTTALGLGFPSEPRVPPSSYDGGGVK